MTYVLFISGFDIIYIFNMYFFNVIFSVIPSYTLLKCSVLVNNIYMEGEVSQILILSPSFYFMTKSEKLFDIIFNNIFNIA